MSQSKKILYIDCFSGIAGDMLLGAFLDIGVPQDQLVHALQSLDLPKWTLKTEKTIKP